MAESSGGRKTEHLGDKTYVRKILEMFGGQSVCIGDADDRHAYGKLIKMSDDIYNINDDDEFNLNFDIRYVTKCYVCEHDGLEIFLFGKAVY